MNNTTRRMPRTLDEAFPGGSAYASSIERTRDRGRWFRRHVVPFVTLLAASVTAAVLVMIVVDVVTWGLT